MPEELLAEKKFSVIPYIIGVNKQELGWLLPTLMGYPLSEDKLDQKTAASLLWKSYPLVNIPKELIPVAIEKYLGGTDDHVKKKDLFLDLMGDVIFGVPSVIMARLCRGLRRATNSLSAQNTSCASGEMNCARIHVFSDAGLPTYVYEFQYRPSFSSDMKPEKDLGLGIDKTSGGG
ncbi:hypothetical protein MC885_010332 [Smutsia gigantea]|nr:hypothetical protein MC885_010332 [Smutsia gigantea]